MIFDPFQTLGYVEDINVFVQPSDTVPYWRILNILYFSQDGTQCLEVPGQPDLACQ